MNEIFVGQESHVGARRPVFLPRGTVAGFVIAVFAIAIITFLSYRSLETRSETADHISQTLDKMERLQEFISMVKDAETGQRGFLLTGKESYIEPYTNAKASLPGATQALGALVAANVEQQQQFDALSKLTDEKMEELGETVELRRNGNATGALALVLTDRGKATMDNIRVLVAQLLGENAHLLAEYQDDWQHAAQYSSLVILGGSAVLLVLIFIGATMSSRDYRTRETEVWLRSGQAGLAARIQGEYELETLGANVLEFLAKYLNAQVGAMYVTDGKERFQRIAGYALPESAPNISLNRENTLVAQSARQNRVLHIRDVSEQHLPISSGLGQSTPRELLIAPATGNGTLQAVIELGFLHAALPIDEEFLSRLSELVGLAVRSSRDRSRLESLLEETQRQAEELQTQQEELRVNNEELEEQGRALKQSQTQLEIQQTELQQSNARLEEHAELLEKQKDDLSIAQHVLSERAADLERSNQFKSEFLANMSHELRTPLNSSLILAKLLADNKDGNLNGEQVKFAQTIHAAGNDLLALINDILDLSKIEAGQISVVTESVPITASIDDLIRFFQPTAKEKGLALTAVVEPGLPETIATDPQRLSQILKNLISNALKFTERGHVSLHVSAAENAMISFSISDSGIGIAADQQEVIFEAFRQADGSMHRKYGGTGLGLSISRDLAHLLGGEITVESIPGHGSTFILRLPLLYSGISDARVSTAKNEFAHAPKGFSKSTITAAKTPPSPAIFDAHTARIIDDDRERIGPQTRLILVIEDDARFAAILLDLAHELNFQCVVVPSANDGLAAAARYRPSAIVLDINLPDHSGLGVLDQLKRNPKTRHIPVHVASVTDYVQSALELGAVGYALKPVKREELIDAFKQLEHKFSQGLRRVLIVEDDKRQRDSMQQLLQNNDVEITGVASAADALLRLKAITFDCVVVDLNLPDLSGYELLEKMASWEDVSFPPVIVYTGRSLTSEEEQRLSRYSRSIIIKDARSPERLLDEVTLFLHQVESELPPEHQRMLKVARDREARLDGRRVLVVEDDVRNIFALSNVLEPKGMKVEIARNGLEAIEQLTHSVERGTPIDLVLMDIMMPEMDGLTAMREIRKRVEWKKLPIIALTAKAMRDDQEKCLAAGANDYIAKPLDLEKLLSLIRVWMPK